MYDIDRDAHVFCQAVQSTGPFDRQIRGVSGDGGTWPVDESHRLWRSHRGLDQHPEQQPCQQDRGSQTRQRQHAQAELDLDLKIAKDIDDGSFSALLTGRLGKLMSGIDTLTADLKPTGTENVRPICTSAEDDPNAACISEEVHTYRAGDTIHFHAAVDCAAFADTGLPDMLLMYGLANLDKAMHRRRRA